MVAPRYLGDGVYASFDGYNIWLGLDDHTTRTIALEPGVMCQLVNFHREVMEARMKAIHEALDTRPDAPITDEEVPY